MDGYLTKPIDRGALTAELERWLPVAFTLRKEVAAPRRQSKRVSVAALDASADGTNGSGDAIDVNAFAEQLGVAPGPDAHELLSSLWDSMDPLPPRLAGSLARKDRAAIREEAHGGKGESKAIGAFRLAELCSDLQDQAEVGSWESLEALVGQVTAEHARVAGAIRELGVQPS